jgi:hypothetical protein
VAEQLEHFSDEVFVLDSIAVTLARDVHSGSDNSWHRFDEAPFPPKSFLDTFTSIKTG